MLYSDPAFTAEKLIFGAKAPTADDNPPTSPSPTSTA